MYSKSSTAKRALLECKWQLPKSPGGRDGFAIAEINPGELAAVHASDLSGELSRTVDEEQFDHKLLRDTPYHFTVMGHLACQVMWPFSPSETYPSASVIVGVDHERDDYRIYKVLPSRLLVATSDIKYMSPVDDEFISVLARSSKDLPRADVFHDNSR